MKKFGSTSSDAMTKQMKGMKGMKGGGSTESDGDKINWLKVKDGTMDVRILPPLEGGDVLRRVDLHFGVVIDGNLTSVVCTRAKEGTCPICDDVDAHYKLGTPQSKKKAYDMSAKSFFLYNVLTEEGTVALLSVDAKCQKEILKLQDFHQESGFPDLWDATKGEIITIKKEKGPKGKMTYAPNIFTVGSTRKTYPITADNAKELIEGMVDLNKPYEKRTFTAAELTTIYYGEEATAEVPEAPAPATDDVPEESIFGKQNEVTIDTTITPPAVTTPDADADADAALKELGIL